MSGVVPPPGETTFLGIRLLTTGDVLRPREETELLGKSAIELLAPIAKERPLTVIDMCCGAGNLACAIASHIPNARVFASDLTDACVALTRKNVAALGLEKRVTVEQGDLFAGLAKHGLEGTVDAVVCNPPYISTGRLAKESAHLLESEPREAFDGGPYGLTIHQRVIREAPPFLKSGSYLMFEIGLGQERQLELLVKRVPELRELTFLRNGEGAPRAVTMRRV